MVLVFGLGLQKARAKVLYISSIVSLVLSLLLIPVWGPVGVAVANLGYAIIAMVGAIYSIFHKVHFSFPLKNYAKMAVLAIVLLLSQVVLKFISPPQLSQQFVLFIFKIAIGLGLYYSLGIYFFKIVNVRLIYQLIESIVPLKFRKLLLLGK